MVERTCPECGQKLHSAVAQSDWKCSCGAVVPKELSKPSGTPERFNMAKWANGFFEQIKAIKK